MGKIYAVKKGTRIGLFATWDLCKEAVQGYSGAEFRSFKRKLDAQSWLDGGSVENIHMDVQKPDSDSEVNVFADGILVEGVTPAVGVIFQFHDKIMEFSAICTDGDYIKHGAIYAKLCAFLTGVNLASKSECTKINIYTNYEGVLKWLSGEWECNSTMQYIFRDCVLDTVKTSGKSFEFKTLDGKKDRSYKNANKLAKGAIYRDRSISIGRLVNDLRGLNITTGVGGTYDL